MPNLKDRIKQDPPFDPQEETPEVSEEKQVEEDSETKPKREKNNKKIKKKNVKMTGHNKKKSDDDIDEANTKGNFDEEEKENVKEKEKEISSSPFEIEHRTEMGLMATQFMGMWGKVLFNAILAVSYFVEISFHSISFFSKTTSTICDGNFHSSFQLLF